MLTFVKIEGESVLEGGNNYYFHLNENGTVRLVMQKLLQRCFI